MNSNSNDPQCKAILIVEDEAIIRENLKTFLELERYQVYAACNGEEGLRVLRTISDPCLVLLDLFMPIMNGMEFLESKSHEAAIAAIPVCIVSGAAEKPNSLKYFAFIKKPFDFDTILKLVRQFCGAPNPNLT
jgi:CheY-like chemotaxis protein